ncbi:hypothetical protein D3C80_1647400 [compost metagenome]
MLWRFREGVNEQSGNHPVAGYIGATGKIVALRGVGIVRCGAAGHFPAHRLSRRARYATGRAIIGAVWLAVSPDVGRPFGFLQSQGAG